MNKDKPVLSVPDKVDKRAEALRANLKRRKNAAKKQASSAQTPDSAKDNTQTDKE